MVLNYQSALLVLTQVVLLQIKFMLLQEVETTEEYLLLKVHRNLINLLHQDQHLLVEEGQHCIQLAQIQRKNLSMQD